MSPNFERIITEVKPDGSEDHIPNPHQSPKTGDTGPLATAKALEQKKAIHLPLYGACFLKDSAVTEIGPLDPTSVNERFTKLNEAND